jgi:hypothetical protein
VYVKKDFPQKYLKDNITKKEVYATPEYGSPEEIRPLILRINVDNNGLDPNNSQIPPTPPPKIP